MSDYATTSHFKNNGPCIVCLIDTHGKCGNDFVCYWCYNSGAYNEWLKEQAAQQDAQADICPVSGGDHDWEPDGSAPHECCSLCGKRR